MRPLWQYLSPLLKKRLRSGSLPPKGANHCPLAAISLQMNIFSGDGGGDTYADHCRSAAQVLVEAASAVPVVKAIPRCGSTSRACGKADETISAPKAWSPGRAPQVVLAL
jgi:hypothetical protein